MDFGISRTAGQSSPANEKTVIGFLGDCINMRFSRLKRTECYIPLLQNIYVHLKFCCIIWCPYLLEKRYCHERGDVQLGSLRCHERGGVKLGSFCGHERGGVKLRSLHCHERGGVKLESLHCHERGGVKLGLLHCHERVGVKLGLLHCHERGGVKLG